MLIVDQMVAVKMVNAFVTMNGRDQNVMNVVVTLDALNMDNAKMEHVIAVKDGMENIVLLVC